MADEQEDSENEVKELIGINLVNSNNNQNDYTSLGVIIISKSHIQTRYINHLRRIVCHQTNTLPSSFTFCTTQGWIITKALEESIKIKDIILPNGTVNIQRCFDKPKVGIKTKSGEAIGFILVEYNTLLSQTREIIDDQVLKRNKRYENYWFVDSNGWPVNEEQEMTFSVIDIINGSCVTVDGVIMSLSPSTSSSVPSLSPKTAHRSLLGKRQLSFRASKDLDRCQVADSSVDNVQYAKQILISYVRADAAHHALELKQKLSYLGFSVYLDVHEIQSGVDWQDSLNFAVSTCEVFVPLVTPRYGETQWTNREVKLADVLGKIILPVSFLEEWPPRCLAIQFATTQYIYWKTAAQIQTEIAEGKIEQAYDIRYWDSKCVEYVAMEIGKRLEDFLGPNISRVPSLTRRKTVVKSCACVEESNPLALTTDRDGYSLIVLCVHPKQAAYGSELKKWLEEKKYEVWCTTELELSYPDSLPNSQEVDCLSQASQCGTISDVECESRQKFQEKADDAGIIVFVVSRDFILSKTCKQQLYYCEQRKRMIALKYEKFNCPGWMSMLIGNDSWEDINQENYRISFLSHIQRKLNPLTRDSSVEERKEAEIDAKVKQLKKSFSTENSVYIAGSTVFHCEKSDEICRKIGQHLATLGSISVVTGGFYGVGESVGKAFYEETQKLWKKHKVWHIVPEKDPSDRSKQGRQNSDGTFRVIDYGKTLFCGDCVRERETIAARTFDICILIEGGPGAAHEAEEFAWNDRIVIPVKCTGGAAGGEFNVPKKIFETPQCVSENDWSILYDKSVTADTIGQAVKRIVECLQTKLNMEKVTSDSSSRIKSQRESSPKNKSPNKGIMKSSSPKGQKTSLSSMKTVIISDPRMLNS